MELDLGEGQDEALVVLHLLDKKKKTCCGNAVIVVIKQGVSLLYL